MGLERKKCGYFVKEQKSTEKKGVEFSGGQKLNVRKK
jgi:hypothetical protein